VSAHVAPHRFADAFAGRLADAEREAIDRHADACAACAKVRARVARASDTFPAIRTLSAPEIAWDAVRARVHWSVSTERRARSRTRRPLAIAGWAAAAAGVLVIATMTGSVGTPKREPTRAASERGNATPEPAPPALVGLASRVAGNVMINGLRPDAFATRITAGTQLTTGDGRIDVQFGDASAFALAPHSQLELRHFDDRLVELVVGGTVDVTVAKRAPGQRFIVVAGDRTVEVRGTQFRVVHDHGVTKVECRHGLVAVRDAAGGELAVADARAVEIRGALADARVVAMSAEALERLERATPATIPVWGDPDTIAKTSAPLEIAGDRRDVRVDGVELGTAPLRVRVMPGRHTVEAADRAGRFRRVGWVDVKTGLARVDVPAEAPPVGGAAARKRELHVGMNRAALAACTRDLASAGVGRTYVEIEIGVDAGGAINFLNIVETEIDSTHQRCVKEALDAVRFGPGPAASWRERIDL
jgi:hypothetical protein